MHSPLRIAIDARMREHSGIGTYIRGLLAALPRLDPPVEVIPLGPAQGLSAPIYGLREQIQVPRAFARLAPRPALLHVPHYNAPLAFRDPLVVTIHDLIHLRVPEAARRAGARLYAGFMIPRVCRRARAIICDSEHTRRDLLAVVPEAAERTHVVHPGCDLSPPTPADRDARLAKLRLTAGYVLYVGNVRPHKNVDAALRAHAALPPELRRPFVLAGADQMPQGWTGRAADGARLLGHVDAADLPALYAGADAFVFPSLYEGFGLPPLEAMACGAPVVCSNATSLPEVVRDAALTFAPADEAALGEALRRVLGDAALREELRGRGLERARRFTWEAAARATAGVYGGVVEHRQGAR